MKRGEGNQNRARQTDKDKGKDEDKGKDKDKDKDKDGRLTRHVPRSTHHDARERVRGRRLRPARPLRRALAHGAEVGDFGLATLVQQHVRRLEVAARAESHGGRVGLASGQSL